MWRLLGLTRPTAAKGRVVNTRPDLNLAKETCDRKKSKQVIVKHEKHRDRMRGLPRSDPYIRLRNYDHFLQETRSARKRTVLKHPLSSRAGLLSAHDVTARKSATPRVKNIHTHIL